MAKGSINKGSALSWLLLGVIGVLLIVGRNFIKDVFYIVLAVGLILSAAAGIFGWWKEKSKKPAEIARLLGSALLVIVGIWILTHPGTFDAIVNVLIGAVLILAGGSWFVRGWSAERDLFPMVLGGVGVALGIVVICSKAATGWPIVLEGAGLIYTAVAGFLSERRFGA